MRYQVREVGTWIDETAALEDHVGDACDLAMEHDDDATLLWRESNGDDCALMMLTSSIVTGVGEMPDTRVALQTVPNPFNPRTSFHLRLPVENAVTLSVYDATGRRVRTLLEAATIAAGETSVDWDGRDDAGRVLPSGVYLARVVAGGRVGLARAVLVR